MGQLRLAWSPFGVAVTEHGHLIYDLEVAVDGLLEPARLGPYGAYVAWMVSPNLDETRRIGALPLAGPLRIQIESMNKFLLVVTAEPHADVEQRSGPIVLRGVSPSGLLQSFGNHELFNNMPHE